MCVLHIEAPLGQVGKDEQHAFVRAEALAVHHPGATLLVSARKFHGKRPRACGDRDGGQALGLRALVSATEEREEKESSGRKDM